MVTTVHDLCQSKVKGEFLQLANIAKITHMLINTSITEVSKLRFVTSGLWHRFVKQSSRILR